MTAPPMLGMDPTFPLAGLEPATEELQGDPVAELRERLRKLRGPEYPAPDAEPAVKVPFVKQLLDETSADAMARYRQATRNLLYANGRQHLSWSIKRKQWEDLPQADPSEYRVTINYIRPILRAIIQRMMSAPVDFSVLPDSNSGEAKDRADVAARFFEARWRLTGMREKQDQAMELALNAGLAAWKSYWNPDIGPLTPATIKVPATEPALDEQGQPVLDAAGQPMTQPVMDPATGEQAMNQVYVDANMDPVESREEAFHYRPGDTDTAVRTVFQLRVNPEATGWMPGDGLRWVIDTEVLPVSVARERYPDLADQIGPAASADSALTYERIAASSATTRPLVTGTSMTATPSGSPRESEMTVIREYWELPNKLFPEGRLIVCVGDGVSPFDGAFPDGVLPFAAVYDEPAPLTPYGRPRVNDMVSPQDVINRQWTAIDAEMQLAAVGERAVWDIGNIPDQLSSEDRRLIRVPAHPRLMNRSIRDVITRLDPPSVPNDRWRLIEKSESALFDIGGFHEVTRGKTPPGVDSGVAIEALLEQEAGQLQKAMHAQEASIVQWARQQLAIARRRYQVRDQRWLPVDRGDMGYQIENVSGTDLPDPQTLIIELDNYRPHSETARRNEVKALVKDGLIDARRALKALDMGTGYNAIADSQGRHYARARAENLAMEQGAFVEQPVPFADPETGEQQEPYPALFHPDGSRFLLPDDDDDLLHMEVHDDLLLDNSKPAAVRQAALNHKAEHRLAMRLKSMVQPQAAPGGGP